jgi:Flp pilus assembly protein TadD
MRQFPEAVEDLTEAIGLLPDWDELHYNRGVCYMELGEFESTGSHPGEQ